MLVQLTPLNPKPSELTKSRLLRAVLVHVAICLDDFWLGVKGLSNLGISGSPRNLCT